MELDAKHQVLFAVYAEYQKDVPEMKGLTFDALGMDKTVFVFALTKLENEGLINGLVVIPPSAFRNPSKIIVDGIFPTREGIEYVEAKLEIEKARTGAEKLRTLRERFGKLGWDILQSMVVDILSKIMR
jgi:hypothetical protein